MCRKVDIDRVEDEIRCNLINYWKDGIEAVAEEQLADFTELVRLARLGAAVEGGNTYWCGHCRKINIKPPVFVQTREHVEVDAREITSWVESYCSQVCLDADPQETQN